jgi:hypothetical protein
MSPIIQPAANYIAQSLLPRKVQDFIEDNPFSAFSVGASVSGSAGYGGFAAGMGGGAELLFSPWTMRSAMYGYYAVNIEAFGAGKVNVIGGLKVGAVYGADWASDYKGPFQSWTLPLKSLPFRDKVTKALLQSAMKAELFLVGASSYPASLFRQFIGKPELKEMVKGLYSRTKYLLERVSDLEVTVFYDPSDADPCGFSIGVSGSLVGHGGAISFSPYMKYFLGTDDVRFL